MRRAEESVNKTYCVITLRQQGLEEDNNNSDLDSQGTILRAYSKVRFIIRLAAGGAQSMVSYVDYRDTNLHHHGYFPPKFLLNNPSVTSYLLIKLFKRAFRLHAPPQRECSRRTNPIKLITQNFGLIAGTGNNGITFELQSPR